MGAKDVYKTPQKVITIMRCRPERDPSRGDSGEIHSEGINYYTLTWASSWGFTEVVRGLLADSRVSPANDSQAIRWASFYGHTDVVRLLVVSSRRAYNLINNVAPQLEERYLDEALVEASRAGYIEIIRLLMKNDSRVNPNN